MLLKQSLVRSRMNIGYPAVKQLMSLPERVIQSLTKDILKLLGCQIIEVIKSVRIAHVFSRNAEDSRPTTLLNGRPQIDALLQGARLISYYL